MNTRTAILIGLGVLCVGGIGNFAINAFQTSSQLRLVRGKDPAQQESGVSQLMKRGVLFDALQGGAPPPTRLAAIATLTRMADKGTDKNAFQELLQLLKDPDTEAAESKTHPVRDAARDAVAAVGAKYPEMLLDAAKDPDGNIRTQAREALKKIGAPLQTQMAARLGDGDLRGPMGEILASIGPETIPLIAPYLKPPLLKPDDTAAKLSLIETMGRFNVAEAAAPILPFEKDKEPNVRRAVVTSLANIGDPVGSRVLVSALDSTETDASARAAAAGALGGIASPSACEALYRALKDSDTFVAVAAAAGLRRAGDVATAQVARALADPDAAVRARAAEAAGGQRTAALAVQALKDADPLVRAKAVASLGDLLLRAASIRSAFAALSNPSTAEAGWGELQRLGAEVELARPGAPSAAVAGATRVLDAQSSAAKDDKAKAAIAKIRARVTSKSLWATWKPLVDASNPANLYPLLDRLADRDGGVAENASVALARLGTDAVPVLVDRLAAGDTVAYYAQRALKTVGRPAVPALIAAARPGTATARWAAVTLGEIGDPSAASALEPLTQSPDPDTAFAAKTALAKVKTI